MSNKGAMTRKRRAGAVVRRRTAGLTIIEVLVVVAIISIMAVVGIPALQSFVHSTRISTTANQFVGTLSFARSEAIKRGQRVTVCKSADGKNCTTSGDWDQGWIVFLDPDNQAEVDDPDVDILRQHGALAQGMTMTGNTPVNNYVSYVASGATQQVGGALQAGSLTLCQEGRGVKFVIATGGRVLTESTECP